MAYKKEDEHDRLDADWIIFPEDDVIIPESSSQSDSLWLEADEKQVADLAVVSRLESIIRQRKQQVDASIADEDKEPLKPAPLWARILFHTPKSNKQVIMYHIVFGSMMLLALALFALSLYILL